MNINKVMVYGLFVVISATVCAMELEKSQDVKRTRPKDIVNKPAESSSPSYSLSFSLPTITDFVNSVSSAANTYYNYRYDDEAFKKLGWPEHDTTANTELKCTLMVYQRVNNYFVTRIPYDELLEDHKVISRRYDYCRRVLENLPKIPKRSEALELATFCLKHHSQVMNDFLKTDFLLFVEVEKNKSTQEVQKADLELAQLKIVPDNNKILNDLFEQTAREKLKKEEEKKKEEPKLKEEEKKEESKKDNGKKEQKNNGKK